jgi:hypothetical protein
MFLTTEPHNFQPDYVLSRISFLYGISSFWNLGHYLTFLFANSAWDFSNYPGLISPLHALVCWLVVYWFIDFQFFLLPFKLADSDVCRHNMLCYDYRALQHYIFPESDHAGNETRSESGRHFSTTVGFRSNRHPLWQAWRNFGFVTLPGGPWQAKKIGQVWWLLEPFHQCLWQH